MNIPIYMVFPKLSSYEFGGFLAIISLIGLIFLSMEVENKRSAIPFSVSLLAYVFLITTYIIYPDIFPTHDSFAVIEYALLSGLIICASIFLYSNIEAGKQAVIGFLVFVLLYSVLTLIPSAYDVLFTEHHLIRESLLLFYGLFQLIATVFGLFFVSAWVIRISGWCNEKGKQYC
ncbi:hypothetical protein [Geoglobus ahangari]